MNSIMWLKASITHAVAGAALVMIPAAALGGKAVPVPTPRPTLEASAAAIVDGQETNGIASMTAGDAPAAATGNVARLRSGLDELARGDVAAARAALGRLPAASLDRKILAWAVALAAGDSLSSSDIRATETLLAGWPGLAGLERNRERAMVREAGGANALVQAFGQKQPATFEGVVALARAHVELGSKEKARDVLSPFWRAQKLEPREEAAIIREFGKLIPKADHRARMERMLYAERINSAARVATLAGAQSLQKAWTAVIRNERNARKLLDAVPKADRSAGYLFAEARYLRRKHKFADAAAVMAKAPRDAAALVDPDAWWLERRVLSRELHDKGDLKSAYKVAADHAAESPENAADAEFHAGWYALRGLGDATAAAKHFSRIADVASGPISRSRGFYWLARAAEAGAPGNARDYYSKAAAYGTCFYGQLAAAKLGQAAPQVAYPAPNDADRKAFQQREAVAAISLLEKAGYPARADILYRDLAQRLTSPGELALLAAKAERRGDHTLALKIGKIASSRGIDVGALSHPIGAIPASARTSDAGKALAYAIARQESEFNASAVSGAGARGLLQLLPRTAKAMAKQAGIPYSRDRLTTDAGYNATLGAAFLGDQLGRFDGSYVLTFAGYNAGPGRAQDWLKRYGDPRGKDLDEVVDWIESIPFAETRSYVQRVMENYQVYKLRLIGNTDITRDLTAGRRS